MTIQVKYCGGCNPRYDRAELVRRITEDFPAIEIAYEIPPGEEAAFVLVVCGCPVCCVSQGNLGLSVKKVISSPDEYSRLFKELSKWQLPAKGEGYER
jgi:4-hydroxybutyrate CoA-transferase